MLDRSYFSVRSFPCTTTSLSLIRLILYFSSRISILVVYLLLTWKGYSTFWFGNFYYFIKLSCGISILAFSIDDLLYIRIRWRAWFLSCISLVVLIRTLNYVGESFSFQFFNCLKLMIGTKNSNIILIFRILLTLHAWSISN